MDWYIKYRTTIWGVIWFFAGIVSGNSDRLYNNLSTPPPPNVQIRILEERVNDLEKRTLRLETDKNMKMPYWSGVIADNIG